MSLRGVLQWWLRLLRPSTATPTAEWAYSHLRQLQSLEALMLLPTVTPDRSGYVRPIFRSVDDAGLWLRDDGFYDWWEVDLWIVTQLAGMWMCMRRVVLQGVRLP